MGPSNSNGTKPVLFWQDFPKTFFEVEPQDIMTILDGFEYAYQKGIKRGQQIRHEELQILMTMVTKMARRCKQLKLKLQ